MPQSKNRSNSSHHAPKVPKGRSRRVTDDHSSRTAAPAVKRTETSASPRCSSPMSHTGSSAQSSPRKSASSTPRGVPTRGVSSSLMRPGLHIQIVAGSHKGKKGLVRFVGPVHFASGTWIGVALEKPEGKHNGSFGGHTYFRCLPKCGIFLKAATLAPSGEEDGHTSGRDTPTNIDDEEEMQQPKLFDIPGELKPADLAKKVNVAHTGKNGLYNRGAFRWDEDTMSEMGKAPGTAGRMAALDRAKVFLQALRYGGRSSQTSPLSHGRQITDGPLKVKAMSSDLMSTSEDNSAKVSRPMQLQVQTEDSDEKAVTDALEKVISEAVDWSAVTLPSGDTQDSTTRLYYGSSSALKHQQQEQRSRQEEQHHQHHHRQQYERYRHHSLPTSPQSPQASEPRSASGAHPPGGASVLKSSSSSNTLHGEQRKSLASTDNEDENIVQTGESPQSAEPNSSDKTASSPLNSAVRAKRTRVRPHSARSHSSRSNTKEAVGVTDITAERNERLHARLQALRQIRSQNPNHAFRREDYLANIRSRRRRNRVVDPHDNGGAGSQLTTLHSSS